MPTLFRGNFAKNLGGFKIKQTYESQWMRPMDVEMHIVGVGLPSVSTFDIPAVPQTPSEAWFVSDNQVVRAFSGASFSSSATLFIVPTSDPILWFSQNDASTDVTRTGVALPATSAYMVSREVADSLWYANDASTDVTRTGVALAATSTYMMSRDVPDSLWYANDAPTDVTRTGVALPATSVLATSRDVPDSPWYANGETASFLSRNGVALPTTANSAF